MGLTYGNNARSLPKARFNFIAYFLIPFFYLMTVIIISCTLLIIAYFLDIASAYIKIPSVILLLALGMVAKQCCLFFSISVPNLNPLLPILGTIGLLLIVLEGSLELEINKSKIKQITIFSLQALLPMLALSLGLAFAFYTYSQASFKVCLANAIPFAIISSAIAIPSAKNMAHPSKEFITYESSLSDIFGVLFFNIVALNETLDIAFAGYFILQLGAILAFSFVAILTLAYLLQNLKHSVKFVPIIIMVILIYSLAKVYHLPALIFILLFGLFLGNLGELKHFKLAQYFNLAKFNPEVAKFKAYNAEITFLIRALFFILFGFLIQASEILNPHTIVWAAIISASIFLLRFLFLKCFKLPLFPLLFIAPRGLITVLLFLSLAPSQYVSLVNKSLVTQVIIITALVIMCGLIKLKKNEKND
jgi:potassium/hydrogen antiporter